MQREIWTLPEKQQFLRQRSTRVKKVGPPIRAWMTDLFDTWDTVAAYGIAGPQIGCSYRLFIWKGAHMSQPEIIINPKVVRAGGELKDYDGCLSLPGIYGKTRRAAQVEITGMTADGGAFRRTFDGFDARIIQHEMDHLEGVLFIDRLDRIDELYTLAEVPAGGDDVEYEHRALALDVLEAVERLRRPLPAFALTW